jgi:cholesterol transport system auxiliary component
MRILILLLSLIILSSCSFLSPIKTESEATYELNTVPLVKITKSKKPMTLLVFPPEANPTYSSTQMVYTLKPYETRYFTKNRWTTAPAYMLQPLMIEALQNTHYFHAVVTPSFTGHVDYVMNSQLLELRQDFSHLPSTIHLTLQAQLINTSTNSVIATKRFTVVKPAPENSPYSGVIAANEATRTLLQELAEFCVQAI